MTSHITQDIIARIRAQWVHLTEEDVTHGLKHRDNLLERVAHRHGIGMAEADKQLREFQEKNPEIMFERS